MHNLHYSAFFGPLACLAAALGPLGVKNVKIRENSEKIRGEKVVVGGSPLREIHYAKYRAEPKTAINKIRVESGNSQGMLLGMVGDDSKRKNWSLGQNSCKYSILNDLKGIQ